MIFAGGLGLVYPGEEYGERWDPAQPFATSPVLSLAVDPQNGSFCYAGTEREGLFRSTDGCVSWERTLFPGENIQIFAVAVDPQDPATVYAGSFGLFKSTNYGETWEETASGDLYFALAINPQDKFPGGHPLPAGLPPKRQPLAGRASSTIESSPENTSRSGACSGTGPSAIGRERSAVDARAVFMPSTALHP